MKKLLSIVCALCMSGPVFAQSVVQSGTVTPGHAVRWVTNGIIGDAGTATSPVITSLGVLANGPGICQQSATSGAYNRLCFSTGSTAAGFTLDNIGGATGGFTLKINGVTQGLTTSVLPVTTGDAACFSNTTGTIQDCGGPFTGFANPTASVSLSAINGTATTAMRSDAAPALNQSITPIWTGRHTFEGGLRTATTDLVPGSVGTFADIVPTATTGDTTIKIQAFNTGGLSAANLLLNPSAGCVAVGGATCNDTFSVNGASHFYSTASMEPPTGTTTRGFTVNQTGPVTGTIPGAIYSNLISGSFDTTLSGAGSPGSSTCACWSLMQISASTGGSFSGVESYGLSVGNVLAGAMASTSDVVGISGGVATSFASAGRLYGGTFAGTVNAGGSTPVLLGLEVGVAQNNSTTSDVPIRYGINIDNYGSYTASGIDTAISIQGGSSGGSWKNGIVFTNPGGTLAPALAVSANIMASESSMTVANILSFPNVTVSGRVLDTPDAIITGSGVTTFGDTTTNNGSVALKGPTGGNVNYGTQLGAGTPQWTFGEDGATSNQFYLYNVGLAANALNVATADSTITLGSASTGTVKFNRNATPAANDGAALGTTALNWSDLFLATGGVINWNNGTATIAEASGNLQTTLAAGKTFKLQGGDGSNPAFLATANGSTAFMSVGRSASEAFIGVAGGGGALWTGTAAGDGVVRATVGRLYLATAYASSALFVGANGHIGSTGGTAPTVSSCGTSPAISGTDTKGIVTTGTAAPTSCQVSFGTAYTAAPTCVVTSSTSSSVPDVTSVSTTALVIGLSSGLTSGKLYYVCLE